MEKQIHNCPTCGSKCEIGGKGETHYYIPVLREVAILLLTHASFFNSAIEFDHDSPMNGEEIQALLENIVGKQER
jgi:hypothetical protein